MAVVIVKAVKPFHTIHRDGQLMATGEGDALLDDDLDVVDWFDSKEECEAVNTVVESRKAFNYQQDMIKYVELPKNPQAYAAMRQDAMDWLRLPEPKQWNPEHYPALAITVEVYNMDPTEAAESIRAAVQNNVLEPERIRTIKRKELREQ